MSLPALSEQLGHDVLCVAGEDRGDGPLRSSEFFVLFRDHSRRFRGMGMSMFRRDEVPEGRRNAPPKVDNPSVHHHVVVKCNGNTRDSAGAVMFQDRLAFRRDDGSLTTTPPSRVLEGLGLRWGVNAVSFESHEYQCVVKCNVWLWSVNDRLFVVDVDGTLTRSDVRGYVETVYLGMYDYIHQGVVKYLNDVVNMGTIVKKSIDAQENTTLEGEVTSRMRVVYLTARPFRHLQETKRLIAGVMENEQFLPSGPLFCNKVGQFQALYGEMVGSTADFKGQILRSIEEQFIHVGRSCGSPWAMGIGNKDTDVKAYQMCNIRIENIFSVQKTSEIHCYVQQPQSSSGPMKDMFRHHRIDSSSASLVPSRLSASSELALYEASPSDDSLPRRRGVSKGEEEVAVARGTAGFVPGDNGGLMIETDDNIQPSLAVINHAGTPKEALLFTVELHVFRGYDDPSLTEYTRHVLSRHHLSSDKESDRYCPFDFQALEGGETSGREFQRRRSLSSDDIDDSPRPLSGRRWLQKSLSARWGESGEGSREGRDISRAVQSLKRLSRSRKGPKQEQSSPPRLRRITSEPPTVVHEVDATERAQPQTPIMAPSFCKSTKKGVKLSQMTDFFNSENYADV